MKWKIVAAALAVSSPAWAHKPTVTTFTYNEDIFPIFSAKCGSCHRTGGVAPMSLLTYKEAYPWGVAIKNEVLNLAMPPWFADERYGVFRHDAGLSAKEMDTIVDWCLGGAPEGETPKGDGVPTADGWPLGTPDLELAMPEPVELDATTSTVVEEIVLDTGRDDAAYIRAVDFRPGAASIVRSATVQVGDSEQPVATWVPGQLPLSLPEGRGYALPAGAAIRLRLHYEKTWLDEGSVVEDRSVLALYLDPSADLVDTVAVAAGSAHTVDADTTLLSILPRIDVPVESIVAELVHADGSRVGILRLYRPSPDWPRKYWLEDPLLLPSGSRVEVSATGPSVSDADPPRVVLDLVGR